MVAFDIRLSKTYFGVHLARARRAKPEPDVWVDQIDSSREIRVRGSNSRQVFSLGIYYRSHAKLGLVVWSLVGGGRECFEGHAPHGCGGGDLFSWDEFTSVEVNFAKVCVSLPSYKLTNELYVL